MKDEITGIKVIIENRLEATNHELNLLIRYSDEKQSDRCREAGRNGVRLRGG